MEKPDANVEASLLDQVEEMRDPRDWLLQKAVWIILGVFGITLLLNIVAVGILGLPEGEPPFFLISLFDRVYQSFVFILVVMVLLVRSYLRQLRETTRRLIQQKVTTEKDPAVTPNFIRTWKRRQDPRSLARILTGVVFTAGGAVLVYSVIYNQDPSGLLPTYRMSAPLEAYSPVVYITNLLSGAGILAALYVIGNWMFLLYQTGKLFRRLPTFFDLKVHPAHPDRSGGFKPAGDLFLKMFYVVMAPALFISFWLIIGNQLAQSSTLQDALPPYLSLLGFRTPLVIILVLLVISGVGIFLWPALALHSFMMSERAELDRDLARIAQRIHHLNRTLMSDSSSLSEDDGQETLAKIDWLQELYDRMRHAPTWPFDRRIAVKFASTQAIPILSLFALGTPFERLGKVLEVLFQSN